MIRIQIAISVDVYVLFNVLSITKLLTPLHKTGYCLIRYWRSSFSVSTSCWSAFVLGHHRSWTQSEPHNTMMSSVIITVFLAAIVFSVEGGHPLSNEITLFGAGTSYSRDGYAYPWLDPFLPRTNVAVRYDLWLHPDFYFNRRGLTGRMTIEVDILADTDTLIVNYRVRRGTLYLMPAVLCIWCWSSRNKVWNRYKILLAVLTKDITVENLIT